MARLPQIVDALSAADGRRDRATLDNIARAIREDGLLPDTLRGRGATPMSLRSVADLLIAVNLPVPRGEAAAAAEQFRSLRPLPASGAGLPDVLKALDEAETFGAALEALIGQAEALGLLLMRLADEACSRIPEETRYKLLMPELRVEFMSDLSARISVASRHGQGPQAAFRRRYCMDLDRPADFYAGPFSRKSDTLVTHCVHLGTILRLHDALAAEVGP